MGFWHTGYMEFHEPVGYGDLQIATPAEVVYSCSRCGATFPTPDALRIHRFESHSTVRPILLIRGLEVGTATLRLTRPLDSSEVEISNATEATINGKQIRIERIAQELARASSGIKDVVLKNDGVQAAFTIRFEIATSRDIEGVERCFKHAARLGCLDRRAIEDFISQSRQYPTAMVYCDGVCEYLYGVLAKERSPESSLPFDTYREKFNRAAVELRDICRPLAKMVVGLVDFHQNHFASARAVSPASRFGIASYRMLQWLKSARIGTEASVESTSSGADSILTDRDTERILRWLLADAIEARSQVNEVEAALQEDLPELDRPKLRILLAQTYRDSGATIEARRHARELINSPGFGPWAESFTRAERMEKHDA